MRFEDVCPQCGSHLIVREGEYGEFFACPRFPDCRYTQPIKAGTEYKEYHPPSPYCKKCNHTGLFPFKKNDKIIPNAWIDCECRTDIEHYQSILPEDIDYPVSYDYYRSQCQYHGWQDPGPDKPLPELDPQHKKALELQKRIIALETYRSLSEKTQASKKKKPLYSIRE